jgi:hypothetical protein
MKATSLHFTSLHFTSLALLSVLSCSVASAALTDYTFVGGTTAPAGTSTFEIVADWEANGVAATLLPGMNDDVTATASFLLRSTTDYTIKSLTLDGGNGTLAAKKLTVTGNVAMNSGMTVKNTGTVFEWEGAATLGDGGAGTDRLEVVYGTHDTKVVGNNLTVAANGEIYYRWFADPTEGSAVPDMDLSGVLTFDTGSAIQIKLDGAPGSADRALAEGSYFLVGSTNISALPELDLSGFWTTEQAVNSFLSIDSTNADTSLQGLYLTVIPEPGTYALLAGCFALASVMIRRRR